MELLGTTQIDLLEKTQIGIVILGIILIIVLIIQLERIIRVLKK